METGRAGQVPLCGQLVCGVAPATPRGSAGGLCAFGGSIETVSAVLSDRGVRGRTGGRVHATEAAARRDQSALEQGRGGDSGRAIVVRDVCLGYYALSGFVDLRLCRVRVHPGANGAGRGQVASRGRDERRVLLLDGRQRHARRYGDTQGPGQDEFERPGHGSDAASFGI